MSKEIKNVRFIIENDGSITLIAGAGPSIRLIGAEFLGEILSEVNTNTEAIAGIDERVVVLETKTVPMVPVSEAATLGALLTDFNALIQALWTTGIITNDPALGAKAALESLNLDTFTELVVDFAENESFDDICEFVEAQFVAEGYTITLDEPAYNAETGVFTATVVVQGAEELNVASDEISTLLIDEASLNDGAEAALALCTTETIELPFDTGNTAADVEAALEAASELLINDEDYTVAASTTSYVEGVWTGKLSVSGATPEDTAVDAFDREIEVTVAEDPAALVVSELDKLNVLTDVEMPFETADTIANVRIFILAAATALINATDYEVTLDDQTDTYVAGTWTGVLTVTDKALPLITASDALAREIVITIALA